MNVWRLSRSQAQALVLLLLVAGLTLVDMAVSTALGYDAFGGQRQTFSRVELASAKALALAEKARHGVRVGLVVGMSTADWGIDLRALERPPSPLRWAKITGEYASFTNLNEVARRFEGTGLQPTRTLLCIHYGMLLGTRRHEATRAERLAELRERANGAPDSSGLGRVITLSWLGNNRTRAANDFETHLGRLRERLLNGFSQPTSTFYPNVADPFADSPNARTKKTPAVRDRHVKAADERWRAAGASGNAPAWSAEARALTDLVARLGAGPGLVVVLMPEQSKLRAVIPDELARRILDEAIAAARVEPVVPVVDIRASLPDEYFIDEVHASGAGRPLLTKALSEALPP